jgi:hypothetical protein
MRNILFFFIIIISSIILTVLIISLIPRKLTKYNTEDCTTINLYAASYGHHLAFVLPANIIPEQELKKLNIPETAAWVEFAWGDSAYFMNPEFDLVQGIKALFTPTTSVMYVASYMQFPEKLNYWANLKLLQICEEDFTYLLNSVLAEFRTGNEGNFILIKNGLRPNSVYYSANTTYHLFYNSNNWVAEKLDNTGFPTPLWGGIAFFVMWHLR